MAEKYPMSQEELDEIDRRLKEQKSNPLTVRQSIERQVPPLPDLEPH